VANCWKTIHPVPDMALHSWLKRRDQQPKKN
jgi:hypothetical protein